MSKNPISTNRTATVSANGILDCWVQQPVDNSPSESSAGVVTYQEKFKGPYSKGKELLDRIKVGDTLASAHTSLGATVSGGIQNAYDAPTPPTRNNKTLTWIVSGIRVQEAEAGDHCFIYVDYTAQFIGWEVNTLYEIDERNVWSLSWQSYSVSPFAFCSNEQHNDIPVSPSGLGYEPNWTLPAMREHIELFKNSIGGKFTGAANAWVYKTMAQAYYLNPTEIEIAKKIDLGKSPVYHYPILVHTTAKQGGVNVNYDETLGEDLDHIVDLPLDCPYKFDEDSTDEEDKWKWIKVGDDMTQTKTKSNTTFERKQIWWGFKDIDENFYGNEPFTHDENGIKNGRWELGKL